MALGDLVAAVLADSPKAYWKCQEASGNPQDSSGNGLHMTSVTGTPDYQFQAGPCADDTSIRLVGGEKLNRSSEVSTVTNDFTIEAWVDFATDTSGIIFYNGNTGANGWGMYGGNAGHKLSALAGGVAFLGASTASIDGGSWVHLVCVRDSADSNRWRYYINGALDTANAGNSAPAAPSGTIQVNDAAPTMIVAHLAIYETVLSATRITAHYNAALLPPSLHVPFLTSATVLYAPTVQASGSVNLTAPFIASTTTLYTVAVAGVTDTPFIASATTVYSLSLSPSGAAALVAPFIASTTTTMAPGLAGPVFDWEGVSIGFGHTIFEANPAWTRLDT